MLGTNTKSSLLFPKLRFQKMTEISGQGWNKEIAIYSLDWKWVDAQKEKLFNIWKENHHPDKRVWYVQPLPDPYNSLVNDLRFAIDGKYLREINRTAHNAYFEWNLQRSFDTVIRELCLEPAISYTQVTFRLLTDCLYSLLLK